MTGTRISPSPLGTASAADLRNAARLLPKSARPALIGAAALAVAGLLMTPFAVIAACTNAPNAESSFAWAGISLLVLWSCPLYMLVPSCADAFTALKYDPFPKAYCRVTSWVDELGKRMKRGTWVGVLVASCLPLCIFATPLFFFQAIPYHLCLWRLCWLVALHADDARLRRLSAESRRAAIVLLLQILLLPFLLVILSRSGLVWRFGAPAVDLLVGFASYTLLMLWLATRRAAAVLNQLAVARDNFVVGGIATCTQRF